MKRRYLAVPLLFLTLALIVFVQIASNRIASPKRARLYDAQYEILAEPAEHGMKLTTHTGPNGMPYLLCEGLRASGKKGRLLREQLLAKGVEVTHERRSLILLHGHGSRKEHHLAIAERFCAAGFTCVIPDLPGHGNHPAKKTTFGKTEVPQLLHFVEYLRGEHELSDKLGLFGLSQGGAIALQLAAADGEQFHSVVTISTFANLSHTLENTAQEKSPALAALLPLVSLDLQLRHKLPVAEISPAEAARRITVPAFIIHGKEDRFIPVENAETIFRNLAHPENRIRFVPEAGHGNVLAKGELIYADICQFYLKAAM